MLPYMVWAGRAFTLWVLGNITSDLLQEHADQRRELAEAKRNDVNGDLNTNYFDALALDAEADFFEGLADSPGSPPANISEAAWLPIEDALNDARSQIGANPTFSKSDVVTESLRQSMLAAGSTIDATVEYLGPVNDAAWSWLKDRAEDIRDLVENAIDRSSDAGASALPLSPVSPESNPPPKSPLVLDLNGDGVSLSSLGQSTAYFDLNGDGQAERTAWVTNGDGLLVRDVNQNDKIDDITELFGSEEVDGFSILRQLDSNGDGKISSTDDAWSSLKVWVDANSDGRTQEGELHSLDELHISEIALDANLEQGLEIAGNTVTHTSTYTKQDGQIFSIADAWFDYNPAVTQSTSEYELDVRLLFMPTFRGFGLLKDLYEAASVDNSTSPESLLRAVLSADDLIKAMPFVFSDWAAIEDKIDTLLLKWADVEDVVAGSRGTLVDARHVAFYEAFTGQAYTQYGSEVLGQEAALQIEKMYNYIKDFYTAQFVAQVVGAQVYGDTSEYSLYTGRLEGEMNLTQGIIDDLQAHAAASDAPLDMWAQFAQFIGYTKGLDNLTTGEIAALDGAIASINDPNFTNWNDIVGRMVSTLGPIVESAGDWGSTELIPDNIHNGTSGDDNIVGTSNESNAINGFDGHDTLTGSNLADRINGGNGNDTLDGVSGDDYLIGGSGDDVYLYSNGNVTIDDTSGVDEIRVTAASGLTDQSVVDIFQVGDDLVVQLAGSRSIAIDGYFANVNNRVEKITFLADSSTIQLSTLSGFKTYGTSSSDLIHGVSSNDDTIYGYSGNDRLWGESGNDHLLGGNGVDDLMGGNGDDTLDGGAGDDYLTGDDPVTNNSSNDTYIISSGRDYINESTGNDKIVFNGVSSDVDIHGDSFGNLIIEWAQGQTKVGGFFAVEGREVETLEFTGSPSINLLTESFLIKGSSDGDLIFGAENPNVNQNETINGYGGDDVIYGGMGGDTIYAGDGNDILNGGTSYPAYMNDVSDDYLDGGAGDDTYTVSDGADTITDASGEDYIEVLTYFNYDTDDIVIPYDFHNLNMTMNGDDLEIGFLNGAANITVLNHAVNAVEYIYSEVYQSTISLQDLGWITQGSDDENTSDAITGVYSGVGSSDPYDIVFAYAGNDTIDAGDGYNLVFAGAGADTITSGAGDDELFGGVGNDTVYAGSGGDLLKGEAGDDELFGEVGNDTLYGGYGADTLVGGDGDDYLDSFDAFYRDYSADFAYTPRDVASNTLLGGNGNDVLVGDAGDDVLQGGADDDTYRNIKGHDEITDTGGADDVIEVLGRYAAEMTFTQSGNDLIIDLDGDSLNVITIKNQFVSGNEIEWLDTKDYGRLNLITMQPDSVNGAPSAQDDNISSMFGQSIQGNVFVDNGNGSDTDPEGHSFYVSSYNVTSANGIKVAIASNGDFTYTAPADFVGTDSFVYTVTDQYGATDTAVVNVTVNAPVGALVGTSGDDTLDGVASDDAIFGNAGNDVLNGNDGNDTIYAADGNDTVDGGAGDDTLFGGNGNDLIDGGVGADLMIGGAGNDTYIVDSLGDIVTENANQGIDVVQSSVEYTLSENVENLVLTGATDISGTGNSLANTIIGNAGNNILSGDAGVDTLYGGDGNDTIDGGVGSDYMYGGTGNDTYIVSSTTDHIIEYAGEGDDVVHAYATYTLPSNVESLVLMGTGFINGTGNTLNNTITGNSSSNTLSGGAGADTMIGLAGNDVYIVDNTNDVIIEAATQGTDTVRSSVSYILTEYVENLTLTGSGALNGTGNTLNNTITGNNGSNTLSGGAGADMLIGGSGSDTLYGDEGADTLRGDSGNDRLEGGAGSDTYLYTGAASAFGQDTLYDYAVTQDADKIVLQDVDFNDVIFTNSGNNLVLTFAGVSGASITLLNNNASTNDNKIEFLETQGGFVFDLINMTPYQTPPEAHDDAFSISFGGSLSANVLVDNGNGADVTSSGTTMSVVAASLVSNQGNIVTIEEDGDFQYMPVNGFFGQDSFEYTLLNSSGLSDTATVTVTVGAPAGAILGTSGNDTLYGTSGDDIIAGLAGADTMSGGTGNDIYYVDDANDMVYESSGIDTVYSYVSYTLGLSLENLILLGTADINGSASVNENTLIGNAGNNTLIGDHGMDTLDGGLGADVMMGGNNNDTYIVDNPFDVVIEYAGEGKDSIFSSVGYVLGDNIEELTLTGSASVNAIGNALNNYLYGNSGDNTLDGGLGVDIMIGGQGNDVYIVDNSGDTTGEGLDQGGIDTVISSVTRGLNPYIENLILVGSVNITGIGNELDNTIIGNSGSNTLNGLSGSDTLIGGLGDDIYYVSEDGGDVIIENLDEGYDVVLTYSSYDLAANLEKLILASTVIYGGGNELDNVINGNSSDNILYGFGGNDTIDGSSGNDTMVGGDGNDVYIVRQVGDVVIENANEGTDEVSSVINYTLGANVENLTLLSNCIYGTGNALDNILVGNAANNSLNGQQGNDTMIGGLGNDTYRVYDVGDVVIENANEGTDTVQSTITYTLTNHVENLSLIGSVGVNAFGNDLDNAIYGNTGANTLGGGLGNDTLSGGNGNDVLIGGDGLDLLTGGVGADTFVFDAATAYNNIDVIKDFSTSSNDVIDIADLLGGYDPMNDNLIDFVEILTSGSDSVLRVDRDGTGTAYDFVQVATIEGVTGLTDEAALVASGNLLVA